MSVDVVLVTGHSGLSVGAKGQGIPEVYFWRTWADSIARACRDAKLRVKVRHRREEDGNWEERQLALVDHLLTLDATLIIDLHFNGGGYPGSTAIYRPEDLEPGAAWSSKQAAGALAAAIAGAQGNKAKTPKDSAGEDGLPRSWTGKESRSADGVWRPAGSELFLLSRTMPAAAVVLEPFDGSVAKDYNAGLAALKAGKTQEAIATALQDLFVEWAPDQVG